MIKRILMLVLGVVMGGMVCASPIFGDHEFTDWEEFGGLFDKIYRDVIILDNEEICSRVLEWPQFVEDDVMIFSLEDCLGFAERGSLTTFANIKAGTKREVDRWTELMKLKFAYEEQLWRQEASLKRQLSLGAIWMDGDLGGEQTTSPIDLVVRWNEIDEILHGEKATFPNYKMSEKSDDSLLEVWAEEPEADEWLIQNVDSLPGPNDYPDGEESFSGGFDEQKRNFNEIASNSLIPGYPTSQTFGIAFEGPPVPTSLQMNVDTLPAPPESPDESEQKTVLDEVPFGELLGVFSEIFEKQSAVELREAVEDSSRSNWLNKLFSVEADETDGEFTERIDGLFSEHSEMRIKDGGQLEILPLRQWNIILDTWIENLEKWKGTTEEFLTNSKS